ncbi:MAG: hypothetical protein SH868_07290 [Bythopirellula sp.]|nr:hypothetical protein [Bythopirellula sp.]
MWCSHCHQEVPSVASPAGGPRSCAKCQRDLKFTATSTPIDTGISLESFADQSFAVQNAQAPLDDMEQAESREKLRRIGRQLRAPYQQRVSLDSRPFWERVSLETPTAAPQLRGISRQARRDDMEQQHKRKSWLLSLLLTSGILGFVGGAAALVWSAAFNRVTVWQWGLTTTIAAEGLLIVGLTWMAARLWHNSRRVNHQLRGVDEQLEEIHELAGSLTARQLSSSQHYYHHFSQVANPQMLVANLRGQIDQLAERMAG